MKIGIDARLWDETGVGRYIRNLVWNLQEFDKKNEYVLFVSKVFNEQDLKLKDERWKIVRTDIRWHTLKEQLQFPHVLNKEKLDLVHFPYFSVPIFYKGSFVITIHDLIINHYPTGKASTLPSPIYYFKLMSYKYIIKSAAQHAQKVIAVSQATKSEIAKHLGVSESKIAVTHEGVERRHKKEIAKDKKISFPYLLYVGNAYPHKNLDRLISAFGQLEREYPDLKLILVGKKNYFYTHLENKVKGMLLDKRIIFAGNINDEGLSALYQQAVALILPSLMEGFGLTGLEAMQEECLVLASNIPSLKEIYQDAAIYFDPLAVESMHATIREVLENKKKFLPLIEKGKKRVATFSWEKMAEQTMNIYESCTGVRSDQ
ncbi:MAG TPA: glycosyltransferase family 1 protein [Candidatus Saccharimonadales bacterium]|nr:glycosyltransferase family 1 protein [Candidatus Saccharimonadales bacterium]